MLMVREGDIPINIIQFISILYNNQIGNVSSFLEYNGLIMWYEVQINEKSWIIYDLIQNWNKRISNNEEARLHIIESVRTTIKSKTKFV